MLFNIGTKLYLLHRNYLLLLFSFLFPFLLLVFIFTKIHNPANRRFCLRGHLYQIKVLFLSHAQSISGLHNTELLTISTCYTHFPDTDFLINSRSFFTNLQTPPE